MSILSKAPGNAELVPFSGYDCQVWLANQADGKPVLVGEYTSGTFTIRDATEAYLTFNQRIPMYLNGEIQIAWVLERGLLDLGMIQEIFGETQMTRADRFNRGPRFSLTFNVNADDLSSSGLVSGSPEGSGAQSNTIDFSKGGYVNNNPNDLSFAERYPGSPTTGALRPRSTSSRLKLEMCKSDSFSMAAMSGRPVVATQIQGLAEGWKILEGNKGYSPLGPLF